LAEKIYIRTIELEKRKRVKEKLGRVDKTRDGRAQTAPSTGPQQKCLAFLPEQ